MTDHQHTWVNTATGVACTTCDERIEAPECGHVFRFDRLENTGQSMRKVHLVCTQCGLERAVLTNRSDEEIAAELRAAGAEVPDELSNA